MKKFNLNLKTIFTLGITSLVLVFSLSFYFLLMAAIEDIVKNSLERRLRMTGKLTESILAKYDLTKYKSEEDKDKYPEEYKDILREMRDIKNNVDGIKFIYHLFPFIVISLQLLVLIVIPAGAYEPTATLFSSPVHAIYVLLS